MKRLMRAIANGKDEVPVSDLLLTAELANVPLTAAQQQLLFKTPYANKYASTWDTNEPRSVYGLECSPRSVKWRAFDAALKHSRMQQKPVEHQLKRYADAEAAAIADQKAKERAEAERLRVIAEKKGRAVEPVRGISDEQLRMVHKTVKSRLSTQFADIRSAFRMMDADHSGNISPKECVDAMMTLNVGVPRKFIEHLVNVADYDRDGEINYNEFARIITCDDITKVKYEGADAEGLVVNDKVDMYKPGITKLELVAAQGRMRDMLLERGGITKMFRVIDEDKSGWASRKELRLLVMHLNLETIIRPQVLETIIDLMDVDGDDRITFKEFARVVTTSVSTQVPACTFEPHMNERHARIETHKHESHTSVFANAGSVQHGGHS